MFGRLTDRARKVMALANQEAQRFQHEYIGTEHILLGLVKEGAGVGANALKRLGVDLEAVRLEVLRLVKPGPQAIPAEKVPQTPRAKKVIEHALEEARRLNVDYVGTEHLLLGLLRDPDTVASQVLMNLGVSPEQARQEVQELVGDPQLVQERLAESQRPSSLAGSSVIYRSNWVVHLLTGFELLIERLAMAKDEAERDAKHERAGELGEKLMAARESAGQVLREFDSLCRRAEKRLEDLRKP